MKFCPSITALLFSIPLQADSGVGAADSCCAALSASSAGHQVVYPNQEPFVESVESYWSSSVRLSPACIIQPESVEDVSVAVSTLVQEGGSLSSCKFAVRSGGHTVWTGAANIEDGVTIDLSKMNSTTHHHENKTASIYPGARWGSVYKTLEKDNVTVAGGRGGPVGVGGFLLGGGNSFHSARVGFACDNVVNYQVVLASGAIIDANSNTNPDLFKALKGGTINFGIVTRFDMKTIPSEGIWGGVVTYDWSTAYEQIPAFVNFTDNIHKDPYASLITMWQYDSKTDTNSVTNAMHYTKPVAYPAAYDEFKQFANTSDGTRIDSQYTLVTELSQEGDSRNVFVTGTHVNNAQVIHKAAELHKQVIEEAKKHAKSKSWNIVTMIQPWSKLFTERGSGMGGNVLGLERFDEDLIQTLYDYWWDDKADDELFHRLARSIHQQLDGYAKMINADNEYVYLNYADKTQDPLKGYGEENVKYIRRVAEKYDPHGVFQHQVPGGFKVSNVN
ncbi:FAD-binding oxidoreductase [Aspergillus glaucus CBS 516.65]|uniref:FAD-binding PCMH-type domain-containing protein n=1 Tax=Aspergillus glaucus CBS 516.65 TaxID=1160497 RepID=A0A1L9VCM2_ASPGL|nr:hypothetical protein ASPGLDRAFT_176772 [Aspergillus glaucus CBS 516.65]OJJ81678.1 hypothetical protein ASPGLDRAFT_176772 [Aspergillus glaucus CBS 516.65]